VPDPEEVLGRAPGPGMEGGLDRVPAQAEEDLAPAQGEMAPDRAAWAPVWVRGSVQVPGSAPAQGWGPAPGSEDALRPSPRFLVPR